MTGIDRIQDAFTKHNHLKVMAHIVGGFPDLETCEQIVLGMVESGVDMIEIQLPFSDPIADGPIIMQANHQALQMGTTSKSVFTMIERLRKKTDIPLLIMSYLNPLFAFGINELINHALEIGVDGFIIPDCLPEEPELNLPELCKNNNLALVPLITPATDNKRIGHILDYSKSPFVYTVLRYGVTGRKTSLDEKTVEYLDRVKKASNRFLAAGFGIQEKEQLSALLGHADCGIVGSALIREIFNALKIACDPVQKINTFLGNLLR